MRALLAALLLSAAIPVKPAAEIPHLVADVSHGKPAVLHFFATWCGACREEFPRVRAELLALEKQGMSVALISVDQPDKGAAVEAMVRKYGLSSLPTMILDAPSPDPVAAAVGVKDWDGSLPATFVYDAQGKLVKSFIGRAEPQDLARSAAAARRE